RPNPPYKIRCGPRHPASDGNPMAEGSRQSHDPATSESNPSILESTQPPKEGSLLEHQGSPWCGVCKSRDGSV
ncbi:MAG: hypothetical protein KC978_23610, partial [Candidatus Omnitrophica bacterium]|nr:hypothetical protein [Candidatus Omnitrophota bacterium]